MEVIKRRPRSRKEIGLSRKAKRLPIPQSMIGPDDSILCLTIRQDNYVEIGENVKIALNYVDGSNHVKVFFICPKSVRIQRLDRVNGNK